MRLLLVSAHEYEAPIPLISRGNESFACISSHSVAAMLDIFVCEIDRALLATPMVI